MNVNDVFKSVMSDIQKNNITIKDIEKIRKDFVENDPEIHQLESETEYLKGIKSIFEN